MKVMILAGGFGTRLSEETGIRPKPMVEVGEKPILWHIMKHYSSFGFNEFVILCGYKGDFIKQYFLEYYHRQRSFTIDLSNNSVETINHNTCESWKVTLLDTGLNTLTGGRIKRAQEVIGNEPFMLTYGDGVSDVNIGQLIEQHKASKKACTLTAVQPAGRFGALEIDNTQTITSFQEKPMGEGGWINGGFFVCEPEVFDYLKDENEGMFERAPLQNLANDGKLGCYKHRGFWKCMDTLADKNKLTEMWESGNAEWKVWK